jgi:hypothetical protein
VRRSFEILDSTGVRSINWILRVKVFDDAVLHRIVGLDDHTPNIAAVSPRHEGLAHEFWVMELLPLEY